jgi:hypothetical protein
MPADELRKEILEQQTLVRKMRLGIHLNKEKDSAKYRREKRALARMLTAQHSAVAQPKELKTKPKTRKVSAPSRS